jgi:hypothetical protein
MKRKPTIEIHRSDTHAAALRAPESPVRAILNRLMQAAPAPLDCGGLLSFCSGATLLLDIAQGLLKQPTADYRALLDECKALAAACIDRFEAAGQADPDGASDYKASHPAWAAIVEAGSRDDTATNPAAAALAVELCVSLVERKRVATKFAGQARIAMGHEELQGVTLHEAIEADWEGSTPPWLSQAKKALVAFRARFESAPPEPPAPKTFEERAAAELRNRAAFASYRRRAGVTDKTCLSRTQIAESISYGRPAPFSTLDERRVAMWFTGMSGLFAGTVHEIPLTQHAPATWTMHYDPFAGHLHRDYRALALASASSRPGNFVPTSYCAVTPASEEVRDFTAARAAGLVDPRTVGDLIPPLKHIQSYTLLYPWSGDMGPSWARWARTLGPTALQVGIDSLLGGLITGDLGTTARSKLHYCEVTQEEIAAAAAKLYAALGWGKPVPMPTGIQLGFGSAVTTSVEALAVLDTECVRALDTMRPANRTSNPDGPRRFHNRYVRVLGSRLKVWLSLRAATILPVRATLDAEFDLVIDLLEKTSAGRAGGMPAVICESMRRDITAYLAHCKALRERLRGFGWHGEVIEWLDAVIDGHDVPLLCEITNCRRTQPIGTRHLLELGGAASLAPDWGRKAAENFLRRVGARWQDIDRHQRHEVLGQEQDVQVSEGTEADWARRLAPYLQQLSIRIHKAPLYGLRTIKEKK